MADSVDTYSPGSLIRARERDWVVLSREGDVLRVRPVDGSEQDGVGLFVPFECQDIKPTSYPRPDPTLAGDVAGALLLKDAVRLTLRSGAGPFRSMGRISITPRPYQLVPLLMALRLDPVRLLIADDVGVGKTIEAATIAREMLDRGLINRIGVLCPPHLCEQWSLELSTKFGVDTAVVQPSRIASLEREIPRQDISLYSYYRHLVLSIDFVKSDKNRPLFLSNAPDLVIVDEAHIAARPPGNTDKDSQRRFALLKDLAQKQDRHIILVTATPHSGMEESFRSILGLLNPSFDVPIESQLDRRALLPHVVQRKRQELKSWPGASTEFPDRLPPVERTYTLTPAYLKLFDDLLAYCRQSVQSGAARTQARQRVRYWAAVAILRCVLSSPAAAEAMLKTRKEKGKQNEQTESQSVDDDELTARMLLDTEEGDEPGDYIPDTPNLEHEDVVKLNSYLSSAQKLANIKEDNKLAVTVEAVRSLLEENYHPIVFCRFVATANYVADQLQQALQSEFAGLTVTSVTGGDGDSEQRKQNVEILAKSPVRVLVATECLSEGINLQESFDAVLHYDLPWNPNRLEQREGRVDRFGQKRKQVKVTTVYGSNNRIDLTVIRVLLQKAQAIRNSTGVSVPVPATSEKVMEAIVANVLFNPLGPGQQLLLGFDDPQVSNLHRAWDEAAERDKNLYSFFAQHKINPEEVAEELAEMEPALGTPADVQSFVANAAQRFNGSLRPIPKREGVFSLDPADFRSLLVDRVPGTGFPLDVTFADVAPNGVTRLGRNHPIVAALCDAVLSRAMYAGDLNFARCGAIYANNVTSRTAIILMRCRYRLIDARERFAEEVVAAAFERGSEGIPRWLMPFQDKALELLKTAMPVANMDAREKQNQISWALSLLKDGWYVPIQAERSKSLSESHSRLRKQVKAQPLNVVSHEPPDIMGCYVLVPAGGDR